MDWFLKVPADLPPLFLAFYLYCLRHPPVGDHQTRQYPPVDSHLPFRSLRRPSALIDAHATTPTDLCTATIFSNFPLHTGAFWRSEFWTFSLFAIHFCTCRLLFPKHKR
ncbi:hypothetical protein B0T13DRAFT_102780 [Neurospora crassa]|nr:hypothetical protein B0T13DRAFT_102780 [Neurospora crassa]